MNEPSTSPLVEPADEPAQPAAPAVPPRASRFSAWRKRPSPMVVVLLCAVFFVGGINVGLRFLAAPPPVTGDCAGPSPDFTVLCEAYGRIKADYVDEVTDSQLVEAAIRGMIEFSLADSYSGYMPPAEYRGALENLSGEFSGVGAEIGVSPNEAAAEGVLCTVVSADCALTVVATLNGSPADTAGLRTGDVIITVDGESVEGKNSNELARQIRGERGSQVVLEVLRDGEALQFEITHDIIEISPVSSRMLPDVMVDDVPNGLDDPALEAALEQLSEE